METGLKERGGSRHAPRLWRGPTRHLLSIRLAAFAGLTFLLAASRVSAEVGAFEGGIGDHVTMHLIGRSWEMHGGACFVGRPKNLVVDPVFGTYGRQPQVLETHKTGPRLCKWLDELFEQHQARRSEWERAHEAAKSQVSMFNAVRRFKNAVTVFPEFQVEIESNYLSLFHDDWYGNQLPWMAATVKYVEPKDGYGVFQHLNRVFAVPGVPQAQLVFFLLYPAPTFNQPVKLEKPGKGSIVSGFIGGTGLGASVSHMRRGDIGDLVDLGRVIYAAVKKNFTIQASLSDFWLNGGNCYMGSRFKVKGTIQGVTLCQFLAGEASKSVYGAYKAAKLKSVHLTVTGVDLFNRAQPELRCLVTEGLLLHDVHDFTVSLAVDTNPQLIQHFQRTSRLASMFRWVKLIGRFLVKIGSTFMKPSQKK
ncbi:dense granule protein GRA12 [Toxoplasma gondii TgCatPRC2]|uniref:Dense granule protein GRA12 n=1 Tax=Toxoplasma gondii TgCatPRC2 TaxID=1130821 RepID=A0A151H0G3_TOXGO|nr:dense granule protein GRA12 [Toxoplasma gondii TgCatPRC2]